MIVVIFDHKFLKQSCLLYNITLYQLTTSEEVFQAIKVIL